MLINEIDLSFNYEPVPYADIKQGVHIEKKGKKGQIAKKSLAGEKSLCETMERLENKITYFSEKIVQPENVLNTITANGGEIWISNTGTHINSEEIISACTFPTDFDFLDNPIRYVCGMSVPPVMIKRVVQRLVEEGVFDYVNK